MKDIEKALFRIGLLEKEVRILWKHIEAKNNE